MERKSRGAGGEGRSGFRVRVTIDRIRILEHSEPWWKGKGEIVFDVRVFTPNHGGVERLTRLPEAGFYSASDRPGSNVIRVGRVVFEGPVSDELAIQVVGRELDTFDPDDHLGLYQRSFRRDPANWFGSYGPGDERVEPETLECFEIWYRIEPG